MFRSSKRWHKLMNGHKKRYSTKLEEGKDMTLAKPFNLTRTLNEGDTSKSMTLERPFNLI